MISITFAPMSKQSAFDYKILASYLLPKEISEEIQSQEAGAPATEVEQTLQANHACQWRNCYRIVDKKQISAECEW